MMGRRRSPVCDTQVKRMRRRDDVVPIAIVANVSAVALNSTPQRARGSAFSLARPGTLLSFTIGVRLEFREQPTDKCRNDRRFLGAARAGEIQ